MKFHNKLASIHDLFFANVLAQSVDPPEKRADTLVRLASAIAERKFDDAPPPAQIA